MTTNPEPTAGPSATTARAPVDARVGSSPAPVANLDSAPVPTARTLALRRNLVVQAGRFALINARMMRMVLKGHH